MNAMHPLLQERRSGSSRQRHPCAWRRQRALPSLIDRMASEHELTELLSAWANGDAAALERLTPLVYDELRRIARQQMRREGEGHTLQPTALVNEAFLRLVGGGERRWQDRRHFYAVCAQTMRHILTDHARAALRQKRGGGVIHLPLEAAANAASQPAAVDHVVLDDALKALDRLDPRKVRIVELRYFLGLGIEETATALGVSPMTVRREWTRAKAWLLREMTGQR